MLGAILYRFPSKRIKVIGITGTNGKSTSVFLISQMLERSGHSVASISSIQFKVCDKVWPNDLKMTMPGRMKIQKFLTRAVGAGCQYVVLEVTSEGIRQHRHRFINFDLAVFTNLTEEHLESHGGFENYKKAKGQLFKALKSNGKIIVNLDDPSSDYFLSFKASEKMGYGIDFKSSGDLKTIQARDCQFNQKGISFKVDNQSFSLNLLGKFNISNTLAAISVGLAEEIPLDKISQALSGLDGIPGRLEIVINDPFVVIVDYAHTPDALEKVYSMVKQSFSGTIIGVLGAAGGGRDRWKRPELGKIAQKYLDQIIVTNEDPYDEDPQAIIDQVASPIKDKKVEKIIDRKEAISYALKAAQAGDLVIITGKGCEPWMCVSGGRKISWDDREIVKQEFAKL